MPPRSEAQRRAMEAAAHGDSTLGIPKKVGQEFDEADEGGKLPKKVKKGLASELVDLYIEGGTPLVKRIMRAFKMNEISAVDRPAQAHAKVVLMKRDFDAEQRRSAASSGDALPDGSFPIKNKEDLANARRLVGHAKNPAAARALIRRRAKELGVSLDKSIEDIAMTEISDGDLAKLDTEFQKVIEAEVARITEAEFAKVFAKLDGKNPKGKEGFGEEDEGKDDKADEIKGKARKAESGKDGGHDDEDDGDGAKGGEVKGKMKKSDLPEEFRKALDRADANEIILKQLMDEREVAEYAKRATKLGLEEIHGETLRKAFSGDKGGQAELEKLMKGMSEQIRTGKVFAEFGSNQSGAGATALDEMNNAAEAYRQGQIKIGKKCSIQQAFTAVYTDPAHAELKKAYDTEELKKKLRVV